MTNDEKYTLQLTISRAYAHVSYTQRESEKAVLELQKAQVVLSTCLDIAQRLGCPDPTVEAVLPDA